jgi:hypothetical protein
MVRIRYDTLSHEKIYPTLGELQLERDQKVRSTFICILKQKFNRLVHIIKPSRFESMSEIGIAYNWTIK